MVLKTVIAGDSETCTKSGDACVGAAQFRKLTMVVFGVGDRQGGLTALV